MKKLLLVLFLFLVLASIVSADHPDDKLGLGVIGGYHGSWIIVDGGWAYTAFSLKIPNVPVFWALNLGFSSNYFRLGVSGDLYFYERPLVSAINLHWMIGVGAWTNLGFSGGTVNLELGARAPIGVSWHVLDFLELFTDVAPSLGFKLLPDFYFPAGGWPLEIGIRFWL